MPIDAALTSWRDPLLAPDQPPRFYNPGSSGSSAFAAAGRVSRPLGEDAPEVWRTRAERELAAKTRPLFKRTRKRNYEMGPPCQANTRTIGF